MDASLRALGTEPAPRFGADGPSGAPLADVDSAYFRAAWALVDGHASEAAAPALAVAASGSALAPEAFVVAARAAEATGDRARARRMYARAYLAAFPDASSRPARLPESSLFAVAATHPGVVDRSGGDACFFTMSYREEKQALVSDGAFVAKYHGNTLVLRAVPSRVLVDRIDFEATGSGHVCFGPQARQRLFWGSNPVVVLFGLAGSKFEPLGIPRELAADKVIPGREEVFLKIGWPLPAAKASIFVGSWHVDDGGNPSRNTMWFALKPGTKSLVRAGVPRGISCLAPGPSGEFFGVDASLMSRRGMAPLLRLDGVTGKLLGTVTPHAEVGQYCYTTRDGKRIVSVSYGPPCSVDIATGAVTTYDRAPLYKPEGTGVALDGSRPRYVVRDIATGAELPATAIASCSGGAQPPAQAAEKAGPSAPLSTPRAGRYLVCDEAGQRHQLDLITGQLTYGAGGASGSEDEPGNTRGRAIEAEWQDGASRLGRALPGGGRATLTIRFARGVAAAMALDEAGYYEFFGDPPAAFRDAASCGELPIDVCADRFEVKGLVARFVAGDMSYREP